MQGGAIVFRKHRRPTPAFKVPSPYNPMHGEQANLRQEGTAPYCAMMQVAEEDTYDDYVICRGFDTRILRFIDYAEGNPNKPGISVAKPYGNRVSGRYEIGEIYPALLPTQGNSGFSDFRQVVFTPPSPIAVEWRVGQNPGTVTGGGLDGGQPADLNDAIEIMYDHNGKVVNWLLIDAVGGGDNRLRHVKTKASCAARNITTGAMSSVSCDLYLVAADGTVSDTLLDITVFNPGGLVASGTWMTILLNEAGQYEFVVARCGT